MHPLWKDSLKISNEKQFNDIALQVFLYQYQHCTIYRQFCEHTNVQVPHVTHYTKIPFLPISFFKSHQVVSDEVALPDFYFESSGTTQTVNSKHYIIDVKLYLQSFLHTFQCFYGAPDDYVFLCLLPNYLEKGHSSLVYMCDHFIRQSHNEHSGFYLNEWDNLAAMLQQDFNGKKKMLIGVTYALIDFAEKYPMSLKNTIVMETGGMKGRKEEWTRANVHQYLKDKFQIDTVHSEYGMTELFSQAYSQTEGIFDTPSFMKILIRDENDPFDILQFGRGLINVIDLANIHSCSFIATDDMGRLYKNGSFEVLGRADNSALRGCSLMTV